MCSLLHDGSLPILGSSFGAHNSIIRSDGSLKKSKSSPGGFWARLSRAAGKPTAALERLVEDLRLTSDQDHAVRKAVEERKSILHLQLKSARSLPQWQAAATELDELEGNNLWKQEQDSTEYNVALVQSRLERMDEARLSGDTPRMMFLVRTALSRHLGGMGNVRLYKHSHTGTKALIECYIQSTLDTLSALVEMTKRQYDSGLDSRIVLEQVLQARQSFGRSALLLSGGGTFGMSHIGVVKCLWEQQLLPRIVSGASAGSIVCSVLCCKTDDEIPECLDEFCYGDLDVFTNSGESEGYLAQLTHFLKTGTLFDISNLTRVMKGLLGDMTFQEGYNRTRRILNITVSSASSFELPRLLNYVTSPNVVIWSAVAASCSVPIVFSAASLLAKDPLTGHIGDWNPSPQRWIDGSVDNDLPMTRLAEMFNVNHFIVSQVNPHVVPFLAREQYEIGRAARASEETAFESGPGWLNVIANMAKDEVMHRMHVTSELGILPNFLTKTRSILSQKYSGDITILPEVSYSQIPNVLVNPTTDFMLQSMLHGERATWPKLSRIQNHCAIELALDDAVQHLRARIAFSPSQVDLRLNTISRPHSRAGSEGGRRSRHGHHAQRKRLRFSGDDQAAAHTVAANSSRRLSLVNQGSATLLRSFRQPSPPRRMHRPGTPLRLDIKSSASPPMFTTGSEADSDTTSDLDTSSTASDSDTEDGAFSPPEATSAAGGSTPFDRRHLFPHASQPSTPYHQRLRTSYFGFSSANVPAFSHTPPAVTPPPAPSISSNSTNTSTSTAATSLDLRMTPSTYGQSILHPSTHLNHTNHDGDVDAELEMEADRDPEKTRRKKFAGSTPRHTSPVRARAQSACSTGFGDFKGLNMSPRASLDTPRVSLETPRASSETPRVSLDSPRNSQELPRVSTPSVTTNVGSTKGVLRKKRAGGKENKK